MTNSRRKHYAMQKAIKAILELGSLKFSDFQLLIHAVIFSQYCDQCLFCLLEPLDSLEKAQKIVNTISHGIWCPLDRNSMDRVTWKTDDGKVYEPTCWRMDENAKVSGSFEFEKYPFKKFQNPIFQVICPSKPTTSSSPSEPKPLQKQPSLADWQINSLHRVLDILQENSDKLDEVTNYEQQDSVAAEKRKVRILLLKNRFLDFKSFFSWTQYEWTWTDGWWTWTNSKRMHKLSSGSLASKLEIRSWIRFLKRRFSSCLKTENCKLEFDFFIINKIFPILKKLSFWFFLKCFFQISIFSKFFSEINFLKILNCIGHKAYGIYKKVEKGSKFFHFFPIFFGNF